MTKILPKNIQKKILSGGQFGFYTFKNVKPSELERLVKEYGKLANRHGDAPSIKTLLTLGKKLGGKGIKFGGYIDLRESKPSKYNGVYVDTIYLNKRYCQVALDLIAKYGPDEIMKRGNWIRLWWD